MPVLLQVVLVVGQLKTGVLAVLQSGSTAPQPQVQPA
jgi:hypothetical protein